MKTDNSFNDQTFLARWLNGDLSQEELERFENSGEHIKYSKLIREIDALKPPAYDKKQMLSIIRESIRNEENKTSLLPKWGYGIAATILAVIGLFLFFITNKTTYETGFGEQQTVSLPDGSVVIINSRSSITFSESEWDTYREMTLSGEAFFTIQKGAPFVVKTKTGSVQVLGTQFNVNTQNDFFEVVCVEGKVKAISQNETAIVLQKGNAFRTVNGKPEKWDIDPANPSWLMGETSFINTPLSQVIISLENQFDIKFNKKDIDKNLRFTGSYTHEDLDLALKTIFRPMEISYKVVGDNVIKLSKKSID